VDIYNGARPELASTQELGRADGGLFPVPQMVPVALATIAPVCTTPYRGYRRLSRALYQATSPIKWVPSLQCWGSYTLWAVFPWFSFWQLANSCV